jgi:hypothetical protein
MQVLEQAEYLGAGQYLKALALLPLVVLQQ